MRVDVKKISKLANLPIKDEEIPSLEKAIEDTLSYIKILEEVDTKEITPTSQVTGLENITRNDIANPSLTIEDALRNTKKTHNGMFEVDAILNKD